MVFITVTESVCVLICSACMWKPEVVIKRLPPVLSLLVSEQGLSPARELIDLPRMMGQ